MSNFSGQNVAHVKPMPQVAQAPFNTSTTSTSSSDSNIFSGKKSKVKGQSKALYQIVNVNVNGVHKQLLVPVAASAATSAVKKIPISSAASVVSAASVSASGTVSAATTVSALVSATVSAPATVSGNVSISSQTSLFTLPTNTVPLGAIPSIIPSAASPTRPGQTLLLHSQPTPKVSAAKPSKTSHILSSLLVPQPNMQKFTIENNYGSANLHNGPKTVPVQTPGAGQMAQLVQLPDGRFVMHGVQAGAKVLILGTKGSVLSKMGTQSNVNSFVVSSNSGQMVPLSGNQLVVNSDILNLQNVVNQASAAGNRVSATLTASNSPVSKEAIAQPTKSEPMDDNVPSSDGDNRNSIHIDSSYSLAPEDIKQEQPVVIEITPDESDDPEESVLRLAHQAVVMNRNSELDQKFNALPDPIEKYIPEREAPVSVLPATVPNTRFMLNANANIPMHSILARPKNAPATVTILHNGKTLVVPISSPSSSMSNPINVPQCRDGSLSDVHVLKSLGKKPPAARSKAPKKKQTARKSTAKPHVKPSPDRFIPPLRLRSPRKSRGKEKKLHTFCSLESLKLYWPDLKRCCVQLKRLDPTNQTLDLSESEPQFSMEHLSVRTPPKFKESVSPEHKRLDERPIAPKPPGLLANTPTLQGMTAIAPDSQVYTNSGKNIVVRPTGKKTILQPTKGEEEKDKFLMIKTNAGTFLVPVNSTQANTSSTMTPVNSNSGPMQMLAPISDPIRSLPKTDCESLSMPSVSTSASTMAKKRKASESLDEEPEEDFSAIEEYDQLTVSKPPSSSSIKKKVENVVVKKEPGTSKEAKTGPMNRIQLLKAKLQKQREEAELASKTISASRSVLETMDSDDKQELDGNGGD